MDWQVKVNGVWKPVSDPQVKASGAWKSVSEGWCKVNGAWKQFYTRGPPPKFWAVDIAISTSSPSSRCTYPQTISVNGKTRDNECYGYTPMAGSSGGSFTHGSWDGDELIAGIKPVSKNGTTWADLGTTASSWANNTNNMDYFTEFPFYWLSITKDASKVRVIFSNSDKQPDSTFQCYAHAKGCDSYSNSDIEGAMATASREEIVTSNNNDKFANSFHVGCFLASGSTSAIYSRKGTSSVLGSTAFANYCKAANARGSDYDCMSFQQLTYLQALFVLLFRSTDAQNSHSAGYTNGNAVPSTHTALATDKYGMAGAIGAKTTRMAFFWIHDLWGSINQFIGGAWLRGDGTRNLYYWLPRQANSRSFNNGWTAATTAATQASLGDQTGTTGSNSWHFIKEVAGTNKGGFYPTVQSGASATTYYADIGYTESSSANANFPSIGGFFNYDTYCGIFYVETNRSSAFAHPTWTSRLSYRGGH